jgi:hypothetical protein
LHSDTKQKIHKQSRIYTEDTHTEHRIHRGYTYRAEYTQRIHIQSRIYTEDTHT